MAIPFGKLAKFLLYSLVSWNKGYFIAATYISAVGFLIYEIFHKSRSALELSCSPDIVAIANTKNRERNRFIDATFARYRHISIVSNTSAILLLRSNLIFALPYAAVQTEENHPVRRDLSIGQPYQIFPPTTDTQPKANRKLTLRRKSPLARAQLTRAP